MAGSERNQSLRQDQVQQFLDHAAKMHDSKVLNGHRGPELFPKPVYEESPFDQRSKLIQETRQRFQKNITSLGKLCVFRVESKRNEVGRQFDKLINLERNSQKSLRK